MVKNKYKASGFIPPNIDPKRIQVYGEALEKITEENDGELTPHAVVEEARSRNHPLHEVFEWEDSVAGEKWRVHQARQLISCITVTVKFDHSETEQKAFHSVKNDKENRESSRIYVTLQRVISEPEIKKKVLADALREVEYWKYRYEQYKELGDIFSSIERTKKKVKRKLRLTL